MKKYKIVTNLGDIEMLIPIGVSTSLAEKIAPVFRNTSEMEVFSIVRVREAIEEIVAF